MKCQDRLRSRLRGASQAQAENAVREHSTEVLVDHVISQPHQESKKLSRAFRVIHLIRVRSAMTGDVDDRARDATAAQERLDSDQIRLYTTVRWRIRPKLKRSHCSQVFIIATISRMGEGALRLLDSHRWTGCVFTLHRSSRQTRRAVSPTFANSARMGHPQL